MLPTACAGVVAERMASSTQSVEQIYRLPNSARSITILRHLVSDAVFTPKLPVSGLTWLRTVAALSVDRGKQCTFLLVRVGVGDMPFEDDVSLIAKEKGEYAGGRGTECSSLAAHI